MCTLCLSDMGDLRDDWLREPARDRNSGPAPAALPATAGTASATPTVTTARAASALPALAGAEC